MTKRDFNLLACVTIALFVAVAVLAVVGWYANHKAIVALCAQRDDLDKRIATTQHVLDESPDTAKTIFGIPRALLESSLAQSRQTRKNLSDLNC